MDPLDVRVNGRPQAAIPVTSRLQYGDGLFETVVMDNGRLLLWPEHLERLVRGIERLGLDPIDPVILTAEAEGLAIKQGLAILKVMVVRGGLGRGYRPGPGASDRMMTTWPWSDRKIDDEAPVFWCRTRLARQPLLAGLKHMNRLEQILAQQEFTDPYWEGLMQDTQGWVVEGTMSNLFVVEQGVLTTPALDHAGVAGVMRGQVMKRAQGLGMAVRIDSLTSKRILEADEVFLSNSVMGVRPILRLGQRSWDRGPVMSQIADALRACGDAPAL
ncbi:aminodeoxychorismate lyase [Acidiferrobacter sp.]|uniref:aminodeoxychorismate lyase n=1 Tax=Acidiferrobacter sp. TaxID=1872107 RepID=UPI002620A817|nr:aminodeoxychorismate lyase [Acidiferrobacter sp.]